MTDSKMLIKVTNSLYLSISAWLGLCKNQKSSNLILSRVNPGCILYADFRNINLFVFWCHLPCPLFILKSVSLGFGWLMNSWG